MLKVLCGSIGYFFFIKLYIWMLMRSCWVQTTLWNTPPDQMWYSVLNAIVDVTDCQFLLYSCQSVRISTNTGVLFSQELCHCTINHRLRLPVWSEHHVLCTRNRVCAMHRSRTFPLFQRSSHYPLPNGQPASPQVLQNLLYNTCDERCVY